MKINNLYLAGLGACASLAAASGASAITHGKADTAQDPLASSVVALVADRAGGSEALCTGTIVDDGIILTAAHCVDGAPERIAIVFGTDVHRPVALRKATGFEQNPAWQRNEASGRGDLALVSFEGGLPDGFEPVALAQPGVVLRNGIETTMVGYGVTSAKREKGAGHLRKTKTVIIGQASATELVTDGHAGSVCFGDSGGPAFIAGHRTRHVKGEPLKEPAPVQWGVASSVMNETCNEASIHTNVADYSDWIAEVAARLGHRKARPSRRLTEPTALSGQLELPVFDVAMTSKAPAKTPPTVKRAAPKKQRSRPSGKKALPAEERLD